MKTTITIACILFAGMANAQGACVPHEVMAEGLRENFQEEQEAVGLLDAQRAMEFWANRESGTWTILVTTPNNISCLVTSGDSWVSINNPEGE